jgi:hypothetical protein
VKARHGYRAPTVAQALRQARDRPILLASHGVSVPPMNDDAGAYIPVS